MDINLIPTHKKPTQSNAGMSQKHNLLLIQNLGEQLDDKFYMGTYIVLGLGLCITLAGLLGQWLRNSTFLFNG